MNCLANKNIVLGVTGSIAAYKSVVLASKLTQAGSIVDVIMTQAAMEFVSPVSFQGVTQRPVMFDMFDSPQSFEIEHIALADRADLVVIAPATANTIAKIVAGIADNLLTCTVLATKAPLVMAPAMNVNMYQNQVTQNNLCRLWERGVVIIGPGEGSLACGETGVGRLAEVEQIIDGLHRAIKKDNGLATKRIIVTAGGTQEPIDPVRTITNRSSGKMGYALAEAAQLRGARVTLITAPTALVPPWGVQVRRVETALEMRDAVLEEVPQADALIMAAAVADYRPSSAGSSKIKSKDEIVTLELVKNPDILCEVQGDCIKTGFAAESDDLEENAIQKMRNKGLDLIVANDITAPGCGFGSDTNRVIIFDADGGREELPLLPKSQVAMKVIDRLAKILNTKSRGWKS